MVKQCEYVKTQISKFESDVISDSGKTFNPSRLDRSGFESDVISDSGKTSARHGRSG